MNPQIYLSLLLPLLVISCSEMPYLNLTAPEVSIVNITSNGGQTFTVKARVDGNAISVQSCGFYLSDNISFQSSDNYSSRLTGNSFEADISLSQNNKTCYLCAYISNGHNEICSNVVSVISDGKGFNIDYLTRNLSSSGSANCYIISGIGSYKFKTVKGNSNESVGSVSSCEVLWETFGTAMAPSIGDLINNVSYSDGYITFETSMPFREGNAVIAARDASGTILWSWHIWLTDQPKGQTYNNGAGVMMDRNLGATSATPGDVGALGLLYQWGRKDPFLGSSSISDDIVAKSTITWPSTVSSSSSTGTISYATSHPTTFITYNSNNYDWYYSSGSSTDNTRWQSSKTIYDPCPAGWRVPDGGSRGVWSKAFGTRRYWKTSSNWDSTNEGMDFSKTDMKLGSEGPICYPASGYRNDYSGALDYVGSRGYYWSVSPDGYNAYSLYFDCDGHVDPVSSSFRVNGQAVRCLQE